MRVLLIYPIFPPSFWSFEKTIELTGKKNDENTGTLTLLLPGNYQAEIVLVKAD